MKLYFHPASTVCRPIMMLASEEGIALDYEFVDILSGEHLKPAYGAVNPSRLVPTLDDDGFLLTESSAILKYIADRTASPAYPKDLQARARVNEVMDWFNANFYKDFGYGLVYPQLFPHHKRATDEAHDGAIEWGRQRACAWLKVLDESIIGASRPFVCGDRVTIADYLGAEIVALGEVIGCTLSGYPNVQRWLNNMKALKSWPKNHEIIDGFAASLKDKAFVTI